MGPIEKNIVSQAKRFKEPIPERIKNKPRLGIGLEIFLDAFYDLEHDRNWIAGNTAQPLPIAWSSLIKYAEVYELPSTLREELLYFVRELDSTYMRYLNKRGG